MTHPKRILLLTADTGGGHLSCAEAVRDALLDRYGADVQVDLLDGARDYLPFPLNRLNRVYAILAHYLPRFWRVAWHGLNRPGRSRAFIRFFWPLARRGMARIMNEHPADLILTCHWIYTLPLLWTLEQRKGGPPVVTLVTDLIDVHAMWVVSGVHSYLVPTPAAAARVVAQGVPQERVTVTGLPVSPRFRQVASLDRTEMRKSLGLLPALPTVLVMGGGVGLPSLLVTAKRISLAAPEAQLIVVAGKNEPLRRKLARVSFSGPNRVYGFCEKIPELMRAADLLVTKSGPSTIAESLACGLPMIISDCFRPQEVGNVNWLVQVGAGVFHPRSADLVATLRTWLRPASSELERARDSARLMGRPQAAWEAAAILFDLAKKQTAEKFSHTKRPA
jgi:1,2-diacylglycerol 3-beta-galactosyltransferase